MAASITDLNTGLTNLATATTALAAEIAKVTPSAPADFQPQLDAINTAVGAVNDAVSKLQVAGF